MDTWSEATLPSLRDRSLTDVPLWASYYSFWCLHFLFSFLIVCVCVYVIRAIFKVFIAFVTILLLFYIFWLRGMWHLSSQPDIEPAPPVLEGEVFTSAPQGSPWCLHFHFCQMERTIIVSTLRTAVRYR